MTLPKAIVVVGVSGVERVHLLHRKGGLVQAVRFYEQIAPMVTELDKEMHDGGTQRDNGKSETPDRR